MIRYSHVSRPYICLHSSSDLTLHSCLRNFPSLQYSSRYSNTMCTIFFIFVFIIYTTNIVPNYSLPKTKNAAAAPTREGGYSETFLFYKTRKWRSLRTVSDLGLEATICMKFPILQNKKSYLDRWLYFKVLHSTHIFTTNDKTKKKSLLLADPTLV